MHKLCVHTYIQICVHAYICIDTDMYSIASLHNNLHPISIHKSLSLDAHRKIKFTLSCTLIVIA